MAKRRVKVPEKIRAKLQQEIESKCPLCADQNVDHFEVHHLDENPENNEFWNLLMLCRNCHSKITKRDISVEEAFKVKQFLSNKMRIGKAEGKTNNAVNIAGNVKNSTVANSIQAKTIIYKSKSKPKIEFADGAIGKSAEKKNYVKHLIDRYNEFKEIEVGRSEMKYFAIWGAIKKEFKASAYQIPDFQFEHLCDYVKVRIDNTKQGRINRGKGMRNYSSFEEIYREK